MFSASSATETMVGIAMSGQQHRAGEGGQTGGQVHARRRAGASTRMPMKPSTTDGSPASTSISGLRFRDPARRDFGNEDGRAHAQRHGDQRCAHGDHQRAANQRQSPK